MTTANAEATTGGVPPGWETRIYPGVQVAETSLAARSALASALGEAGVEAEYFVLLLVSFPGRDLPAPEAAERLYNALEAWAARMVTVAASLEVATQGYLGELEALHPELQEGRSAGALEVWWATQAGDAPASESLALRLRRCGQSYRQVAESRLPDLIKGISEQMALLLRALGALPPAGVAPLRALYHGLNEMTLTLQGDLIPRRIRDMSHDSPGLVTTVSRLRAQLLTPAPIEADIAWARERLAEIRGDQQGRPRGLGARLFGVFGRKGGASQSRGKAVREWEGVLAALVSLQRARARP
jgi:hypothetical protein